MGKKTTDSSVLFGEQKWRGTQPMPQPHFSQPNTGVKGPEAVGRLNEDLALTSLRVKSGNVTENLESGITGSGGDD